MRAGACTRHVRRSQRGGDIAARGSHAPHSDARLGRQCRDIGIGIDVDITVTVTTAFAVVRACVDAEHVVEVAAVAAVVVTRRRVDCSRTCSAAQRGQHCKNGIRQKRLRTCTPLLTGSSTTSSSICTTNAEHVTVGAMSAAQHLAA
jgi:hypothetical protein